MADKNIVDDYYSNMKGGEKKESEPSDNKVKIKPKRKIVVKKAPAKAVENKQSTTSSSSKDVPFKPAKPWTWKKVEKKDSKQFVQKMDVVKAKPSEFKPERAAWVKKPSIYARPYVDKKTGGSTKEMVANNEWGANVSSRWSESRTQVWKNKDAVAWQKTNYSKSSNAGKKFNSSQKTRGRFRSTEDTNFSFAKWNKLADIKKEEKNIADIQQNLTDRSGETVILNDIVSLKEFSEKIGVTLPKLMAEFMKNGMMVNINSKIDFDTASIVAEAFEIKVERDNSGWVKVEDILTGDISDLLKEDDESKLIERSPVISIMGHVDHGKTSLLDHIRKSKVTDWEAGGITQSIWAYQVEVEDKKITFLDTPGHEAFTVMRARGAKCTDIAILVVAADEWVKPQTIESINHAKEAGIPVIVAVNKMDKEGANPDFVKGQLSENGLTPEDWGGDTPVVPVSAHTGFGIEDLLEIILLVSEMKELKANPNRTAIATVIESHLDLKLWPVATVLLNTGTIEKGDNIVCQESYGKVKILKNHSSKNIKKAGPSEPVLIVGLDKVVQWWDIMQVVASPEIARQKSIDYNEIIARNKSEWASSIELLMLKIKAWNLKQLKVIVKADTNWALEAMKWALVKLSTEETTVSVIHSGVWSITEGDIVMGQWSGAILIWFSVTVLPAAKSVLQAADIEYINSDIIYHVTERIEKIVSGMLDPKEVEVELWKAKVGGLFFTSKEFMIVGLIVQPENKLEKNALVRVIRNKKVIWHGKIESLKQGLIEVNEVEWPTECGIKFVWDLDIEMKDELEVYKIVIEK
jgi:translation initiation factor IF-2